MRLGNVNARSNTASAMGDCRDGFISDSGDFGDDGRSDTTELPDPQLPMGAPESPILYPREHRKFKSLDEILPSFDSTEPSDDENQPPDHVFPAPPSLHSHQSYAPHVAQRPVQRQFEYEDENEHFDDEGDETYIVREEDDYDDADYEDDDLDDVPLKMRRERKLSAAPALMAKPKPQHQTHPKGIAKIIKRQSGSPPSKPRPLAKPHPEHQQYPISPASPPSSRKPSVASSGSFHWRPQSAR